MNKRTNENVGQPIQKRGNTKRKLKVPEGWPISQRTMEFLCGREKSRCRDQSPAGGVDSFDAKVAALPLNYRRGWFLAVQAIRNTIERYHHIRTGTKKRGGKAIVPAVQYFQEADILLSQARRELRHICLEVRAKDTCKS